MDNMGLQKMDKNFKQHDEELELKRELDRQDYCINGIEIRSLYFVDDIGVWRFHEDPCIIRNNHKTFDKHLGNMGKATSPKKTAIITTRAKSRND